MSSALSYIMKKCIEQKQTKLTNYVKWKVGKVTTTKTDEKSLWFWIISDRRKFRSETSDDMDRWKAQPGRSRARKKLGRGESQKGEDKRWRKSKREDAGARKGREVAKPVFFPVFCGSGRSKSRRAKAAGAAPAGQVKDEKWHPVVARSTFWSKKWQTTPFSEHLWKLRCPKSARCCGAKHIGSEHVKNRGF